MKPSRTYKDEYLIIKLKGEDKPILARLYSTDLIPVAGANPEVLETVYRVNVYDSKLDLDKVDHSRSIFDDKIEWVLLGAPDYRIGNFIKANEAEGIIVENINAYIRVKFLPGEVIPKVNMGGIGVGGSNNTLQFPMYDSKKPIPITRKWLLDFGFDESGFDASEGENEPDNEYTGGVTPGQIAIWPKDFNGYLVSIIGEEAVEIEFVHQLQNLVADRTGHSLEYSPK